MDRITVFISYAREDLPAAEVLRCHLQAHGFAVWLDVHDILPGERWDEKIQQGLHSADFVLLCLSRRSVSKRGYLQREVKKALELATEMLDEDIYLLPVRIDDCELPASLSAYQWVDYFGEHGPARLIAALHEGAKRRGLAEAAEDAPRAEENADLSTLGGHRLLDRLLGRKAR